jgi:hypothetical protein
MRMMVMAEALYVVRFRCALRNKYMRKKVGKFCCSEEKGSNYRLNEDLHGTDSENHTNGDLGPTIHL